MSTATAARRASVTAGPPVLRLAAPLPNLPDPIVLVTPQPAVCAECGLQRVPGDLVHLEERKPLCLDCALLGTLTFLPSGDVALTRRASARSKHKAIVLEWTPRRKRYERRGTLLEAQAIRVARSECAADADARARQRTQAALHREVEDKEYVAAFTEAVMRQFPGCPLSEAREIAAHACTRSSGRVGRTAAAKELDAEKVRLAVIAHVRHLHTNYDSIIERTHDKRGSRAKIKDNVTAVLQAWTRAAGS